MANIKQQKKRILVAERQRVENIRYRSSIKTGFRRLIDAVQSGDAAAVEAAHQHYISLVDRAAAKHALHEKTAARKKSRATRVIARGPQVEETKKRRVTRKTATKAAPKQAAAEAAVEEAVEAVAEEAVEAAAEETPAVEEKKAPAKKPAAKKAPAKKPAAKKDEAPAEEPAAEADAPADES